MKMTLFSKRGSGMPGIAIRSFPRRKPVAFRRLRRRHGAKHSMTPRRFRNSFAGLNGLRYNAPGS